MTDAPYVIGGYALTTAVVVGYAVRMLARARALARSVPSDDPPAPEGE